MGSESPIPHVPRRVVVISSICWLAFTALSALLEEQTGFAAEMIKQLLMSMATAAFGISGFAVLIKVWQRRESLREKVQEDLKPFVEAMSKAAKACGKMASIYASGGSAVFRCSSSFDSDSASILLQPPLLWDRADIATFYGWAQIANQHMSAVSVSRRDDKRASADDARFIKAIRAASQDLEEADNELQHEIKILIEFQLPGASEVSKAAGKIHEAVLAQSERLGNDDVEAIVASWRACGALLMSVADLASGLDECWRSVNRDGNKSSSLAKARRVTEENLHRSAKTWVLAEIRMRHLNGISAGLNFIPKDGLERRST